MINSPYLTYDGLTDPKISSSMDLVNFNQKGRSQFIQQLKDKLDSVDPTDVLPEYTM